MIYKYSARIGACLLALTLAACGGGGTTVVTVGGGTVTANITGLAVNASKAVSTGDSHSCAIKADKTVVCWGNNQNGQLGSEGFDQSLKGNGTPVVGITNAVELTAGYNHSCALLASGLVACWGDNQYGKLGNGGDWGVQTIPTVVVGITNAVSITAGSQHTCAVLADGTVSCWGSNNNGQLGNSNLSGNNNNNKASNSSKPAAAGGDQLTPLAVPGLTGVKSLSAGDSHTCALKTNGSVVCFGNNGDGELGDGTTTFVSTSTPVAVAGLGAVSSLYSGLYHNCAVKADTTVMCWGGNWNNQLGNGDTNSTTTAVVVAGLTGVKALSGGDSHTCALKTNGTVGCWGGNGYGQLGDGTVDTATTSVVVTGLSGVTALSTFSYHNCALKADGSVACWGNSQNGQLGNGTAAIMYSPVAVPGMTGAKGLDTGNNFSCAVQADTSVKCWGQGSNGQLGNGNNSSLNLPPSQVVDTTGTGVLTGVTQVSAGTNHACAVLVDGSAVCWGANWSGQFGDGTIISSNKPVVVTGLTTTVAISAGRDHTCAVLADGTAACWGYNGYDQLGTGVYNITTPQAVTGLSNVKSIAASAYHSCAVMLDGSAACWGVGWNGRLGNNNGNNSSVPVAVDASGLGTTTFVALDLGQDHSCALMADGTAACWGANSYGQSGLGSNSYQASLPTSVPGLSNLVSISAGTDSRNSCAIKADGTAVCWGANWNGQLGNGSANNAVYSPTVVTGLTGLKTTGSGNISSGYSTTCALKADGSVACWGSGGNGELGDNYSFKTLIQTVLGGLIFWK